MTRTWTQSRLSNISVLALPDPARLGGEQDVGAEVTDAGDVEVRVEALDPRSLAGGHGFAGRVVAGGAAGCELRPGDRVFGVSPCRPGGRLRLSADLLLAAPADWRPRSAAAQPLPYLTALYALKWRAVLVRGERLLVWPETDAVGLASLAVAHDLGATVYTLADPGSGRRRVDVVLGVPGLDRSLEQLDRLAPGGRFVALGDRGLDGVELSLDRLRHNRSLLAVDLTEILERRRWIVAALLWELRLGIVEGRLPRLPEV